MTEISLSHRSYSTVTQANAIIDRYIIFLRTNHYESPGAENFGANLVQFIKESPSNDTLDKIATRIKKETEIQFPDIFIKNIEVGAESGKQIYVNIEANIVPTGDTLNISTDIGG